MEVEMEGKLSIKTSRTRTVGKAPSSWRISSGEQSNNAARKLVMGPREWRTKVSHLLESRVDKEGKVNQFE